MSTSEGKPEAGAAEVTRLNLGVRLKAAREARGMSERDVAQRLRLDLHIVRALEADDLERLPALTFVRGYLRNYARLVGLDEALVREALPDTGESEVRIELKSAAMAGGMPRKGLPWGRWLRNLILLAVLAAVLVLVVPRLLQVWDAWQHRPMEAEDTGTELALPGLSSGPAPAPEAAPPGAAEEGLPLPGEAAPAEPQPSLEELPAPAGESASVAEEAAEPAATPAEEPPAGEVVDDAVPLVLGFSEDSWVEINDRDSRLLYGLMPAGTRRALSGHPPFRILLGNAPGVSVEYRGEALEMAPYRRGKVARFRLD